MKLVGLDLSGKPENPSGFCILITPGADAPLGKVETRLIYSDNEILDEIEKAAPNCIAIDAPFWLPRYGSWRPSEIALMRRGFTPVSTLIPSMKMLADRAMKLNKILKPRYNLIECFSHATEKILGLSKEPRKNKDEYDALLCALTAKAYLENKYENLEGVIVPK